MDTPEPIAPPAPAGSAVDTAEPISPLTPAEQVFLAHLEAHSNRDEVLAALKTHLQTAMEIELATIPIYLYAYYSINRTATSGEALDAAQLYANKAGGIIMSVAVEEMLHMSLAANVLFAMGVAPRLYGRAPAKYPTGLPHHRPDGLPGPDGATAVRIPLARLGFEQLWHFLQIENPEQIDDLPLDCDWTTIGQFYSYIRCLLSTSFLTDDDFRKGDVRNAIQPDNYSPNNVDTLYPDRAFNPWTPAPASPPTGTSRDSCPGAAAVARYADSDDSYVSPTDRPSEPLLAVRSRLDALAAIDTITDQGEGYPTPDGPEDVDDPSKAEESHYWKFLTLQAQLPEYARNIEKLAPEPPPPAPIAPTVVETDLAGTVYAFPDNPTTADYPAALRPISDFGNGLFTYMLIMTETIYRVPPESQKKFFNEGLHRSMIWVMDKYIRAVRNIPVGVGQYMAPTFENVDLGKREDSFGALKALGARAIAAARSIIAEDPGGPLVPVMNGVIGYVVQATTLTSKDGHPMCLPDVGPYWSIVGKPVPDSNPYAGAPAFIKPAGPQPDGMPLHACMGLNACRGSDRFGIDGPPGGTPNDCAGQGYCATTADHFCHVQNDCRNQGGCGLYGTAEEMDGPGLNDCRSLGSCATPINAERFVTNGPNRGRSVWLRARAVFEEKLWPGAPADVPPVPSLREELLAKRASGKISADQPLPEKLGPVPAPFAGTGPAYQWISDNNMARGNMTACGGSGMSGAGGCA